MRRKAKTHGLEQVSTKPELRRIILDVIKVIDRFSFWPLRLDGSKA